MVLLDLPGLLFFTTYTLLVLFWAEIYYQARSLPTDKLRAWYISVNCIIYVIQYANRRPLLKPASFTVKDLGVRLLNQRCMQHPRVQNLDKEIRAKDDFEFDDELDGPRKRFRERGEEKVYDKDPEVAEILGTCLDDPDKARSKMEERLRKKRNRILQTKTGSGTPITVTFNKLGFMYAKIWILEERRLDNKSCAMNSLIYIL